MANECIPLFRPGADFTAATTTAVGGGTCVALTATRSATTGLVGVGTATAAQGIAGVAAFDAPSTSRVAVIRGKGVVLPLKAGTGGVTALSEVEVGTNGRVINKASGVAIGRAWEAGAVDTYVMVELY